MTISGLARRKAGRDYIPPSIIFFFIISGIAPGSSFSPFESEVT